ncbi:MAG TPA: ABC transporter permease [Solirubrobacteraceae bacterium]|jgi:peptide/nickel transport system permease protein|nr:ABC transporter permease [Solirubrobacteraceae bacterium]
MARYIVRRLAGMVLLLILVSGVTFIIFNVFPSTDPAALRAGRQPTPQIIERIRADLGLERPLYVQFGDYIYNVFAHLDFGRSYVNNTDVLDQIRENLPATISLAIGGVVVWLTFGLAVGIISAVKHRSVLDRAAIGLSLIAISAPVYWLGLVALYLFAPDFGVFGLSFLGGQGAYTPFSDDPVKWFQSLVLPWFVLATTFAAVYARLLRGSLLDVLGEDYIRTARAKGLSERTVVLKHGVRSAITPVVTVLGLDIGILLGGAILTESVFNIPGIGRLAYEAILRGDLPIVQGTVLFGAFFIVIMNLIVDILYAFLDPRVRY